jgi:hypothetical protein
MASIFTENCMYFSQNVRNTEFFAKKITGGDFYFFLQFCARSIFLKIIFERNK